MFNLLEVVLIAFAISSFIGAACFTIGLHTDPEKFKKFINRMFD